MRKKRLRTAMLVDAFIANRRARGCSPKYEAWLRYMLAPLARACPSLPERPEPVEGVLGSLNGLSEATRYDVWAAIRLLYRWAAERFGAANAAALVPKPLRRPKLMRTLSKLEVEQLLWANRSRPRENALLRLLLDTGLRIGEVAGITWRDLLAEEVDGEQRHSVRVRGKTGERQVPLLAGTYLALHNLMEGDTIFRRRTGGALPVGGLQKVVVKALRRADLGGGPHMLRHTFGRLYVINGGDVFSLQRIMGHRQIATTKRYIDLDLRDVQDQHAKFSPLARSPAATGMEAKEWKATLPRSRSRSTRPAAATSN